MQNNRNFLISVFNTENDSAFPTSLGHFLCFSIKEKKKKKLQHPRIKKASNL